MTRSLALGGVAVIALLAAGPAEARDRKPRIERTRTTVTPYIAVDQTVFDDLDRGGGGPVSYTDVTAGIDVSMQTERAQLGATLEYSHQFSWQKNEGDLDSLTGLVRGGIQLTPWLSAEAGAIATRTRVDNRGAAPGFLDTARDNVGQLYSIYAGPTVATNVGPVALDALYRYGYTKVDSPDTIRLAPGFARRDVFDSAQTQLLTASASTTAGTVAPFAMALSAGWRRDDGQQLDQRFDDKYVRGDVTQPVSRTLAVTAGVGYEKLTSSNRDPLLDGNGDPVVDRNGRYVTDEGSPRRIAYDFDGVYWDAGVIWRPNPRASIEAHVGQRYDMWLFTGTGQVALGRSVGIGVGVYDVETTFGQQLQDGLSNLPTSFLRQRDAFSRQFTGCVFGTSATATGGCLNDVFQSISSASYHLRGVEGIVSYNRGALTLGAGAGYSQRRFHAPDGAGFVAYGIEDHSYFAQIFADYQLDRNSGLSGSIFADWYNSDVDFAGDSADVTSTGLTAQYYRNFGRLTTSLSGGYYRFLQPGYDAQNSAQGQFSARYSF